VKTISDSSLTLDKPHPNTVRVLNRLKRLEGQVRGLQRMVAEGRECHEILTLLSGVRSALDAVGQAVLENYLEECRAKGSSDIQGVLEAVRLLKR